MEKNRPIAPIRLAADNFTPPSRTPWGGRRIVEVLKRGLVEGTGGVVGEAWELSVDPAFPSRIAGSADTLAARIEAAPEGWLGRDASSGGTPILVKLLDTADRLSVQVHPDDTYSGLAVGESGKPECWYVLHAAPDAGIYLGLAKGVARAGLQAALEADEDITEMLHFVRCKPGDCFVIGPGTIHAIGAGLTLVEPQLVQPGRSGTTYRLWDWGRRYGVDGTQDPAGSLRALHLTDALAVVDFEGARGEAFVQERRGRVVRLSAAEGVTHERVCQLERLSVERIAGTGTLAIAGPDTLACLLVTHGQVMVGAAGGEISARMGETLALPAQSSDFGLRLQDGEAIFSYLRADEEEGPRDRSA